MFASPLKLRCGRGLAGPGATLRCLHVAVSFTTYKIDWQIFHNPSPYAIRAVDQKAEQPGFDQKQEYIF